LAGLWPAQKLWSRQDVPRYRTLNVCTSGVRRERVHADLVDGGADIPPVLAGPDEALSVFQCELRFSPPVPLTPPGWGGSAADWLFGTPIGSAGAPVGSG
jgi:hypothetical protein